MTDPRLRRTLVVGGRSDHVFGTIAKTLATYGLGVTDHHPMEKHTRPTLPKNAEAVVVFNDMVYAAEMADDVCKKARDRGLVVIRTSRQNPSIIRDCERAGLTVLPPVGTAPPTPRVVKRYVAHPPGHPKPLDLPEEQWAESIEDARGLASIVWPTIPVFHVTDDVGYLVSTPKNPPTHEAPVMAAGPPDKTFIVPMKPPELARIEAALDRFNLIRDISGQPMLTLDEFVVRLLGDGLAAQEAKFARLAAVVAKS